VTLAGPNTNRVLFLVAAVQFINIVDFMMVMPLGPDFATSLGIPTAHLGYVGGAYTAAASLAGLVGAVVLDRFDRRTALGICMIGLMTGTALGGVATGMVTLLAARVVAGAFGGPASSISLAIVSDVVPPDQRGRAIGYVMGAFSAASVLGVPAGLELSRLATWRAPFFFVATLGLAITAATYALLPPIRFHLEGARTKVPLSHVVRDPLTLLALAVVGLVAFSAFLVIPNFSAYFQFNAGYPRSRLGLLYLVGGSISFFAMRVVGWLVDRVGASVVIIGGTIGFAMLVWLDVVLGTPLTIPAMAFFVLFMIFQPSRAVPANTIGTRVPPPAARASYQSLQSSMQHMACALGAIVSARMLTERAADHVLEGIGLVGWCAIGVSMLAPPLMIILERGVRRREHHLDAVDEPVPPSVA
jgi:predicted MFS family arabinose efflux permease